MPNQNRAQQDAPRPGETRARLTHPGLIRAGLGGRARRPRRAGASTPRPRIVRVGLNVFSINHEHCRLLGYVGFWLMAAQAILVTKAMGVPVDENTPLYKAFGYNNICTSRAPDRNGSRRRGERVRHSSSRSHATRSSDSTRHGAAQASTGTTASASWATSARASRPPCSSRCLRSRCSATS